MMSIAYTAINFIGKEYRVSSRPAMPDRIR